MLSAPRANAVQLLSEDDILGVPHGRSRSDVTASSQHGTDRRDPDPARDEEHPISAAYGVGEDAERPFGDDAGTRPNLPNPPREISHALTVMRSEFPSGAADSENGCEDHHDSGEEAPEEELARAHVKPLEMPAGDAQ